MIVTKAEYEEIKENLVDSGMNHCNVCDANFIVRNDNDGYINELVCPCCGVFGEDHIESVFVKEE